MRHVRELARGLLPPERLDVPAWALRHIALTPRQATAFAGPYRVDLTPHLRGIFDALTDARLDTVVLCKGAQAGATLLAYVWTCYAIAEDPGPILIVMPSEQLASSASENRLQPLIQDSARMREEMPSDPDRFKKLEYQMRGCTLNWVGSNSPGNLASRPVRYLILDEVDKYPVDNGAEGNAIALAIQRTKTFWNRRIFMLSTPTTEHGNIWRNYLKGDQRKYFIPCKTCGHMQDLKWKQVRFDATLPAAEAARRGYYECESCGARWSDADKIDAMPKGEWRSTAQSSDVKLASFHLSSMYSPWTKWSGLISAFMSAKNHPDMLHDFINSELGEPWIPDVVRVNDNAVRDRMKPYTRGQTMKAATCFGDRYKDAQTMIAIAVDVQKSDLRFIVRQFAKGGDSILIDYGVLHTWNQVSDMADALGNDGVPVWVMVDSGYGQRTQEVYEACHKFNFIPAKGASERMRGLTWAQSNVNPFEGTKKQDENLSIALVTFDTISLKLQLVDRIQGKSAFAWHVFSGIDDDYARQVTAEEYSPETGKFDIRRGYSDNHFGDCEVMALLAATIAGFNSIIYGQP